MNKKETPTASLTEDIVYNMLDSLKKDDVYNKIILDKLKELVENQELTKSDKIIEALKADLEEKNEVA